MNDGGRRAPDVVFVGEDGSATILDLRLTPGVELAALRERYPDNRVVVLEGGARDLNRLSRMDPGALIEDSGEVSRIMERLDALFVEPPKQEPLMFRSASGRSSLLPALAALAGMGAGAMIGPPDAPRSPMTPMLTEPHPSHVMVAPKARGRRVSIPRCSVCLLDVFKLGDYAPCTGEVSDRADAELVAATRKRAARAQRRTG